MRPFVLVLRCAATGFLCELLTASPANQRAVNAALGSQLSSSVVVEDRSTASKVVHHFSRARVGLVTCVILDELQAALTPNGPEATSPASQMSPLEGCIEAHSPRLQVLATRLGRGWQLAQDSSSAIQAARSRRGNVVTVQGEVFLASGEIQQAPPPQAAFAIGSNTRVLTHPTRDVSMPDRAVDASRSTVEASIKDLRASLQTREAALLETTAEKSELQRAASQAHAAAAASQRRAVLLDSVAAAKRAALAALDTAIAEARIKVEHEAAAASQGDPPTEEEATGQASWKSRKQPNLFAWPCAHVARASFSHPPFVILRLPSASRSSRARFTLPVGQFTRQIDR